MGAPCRALNINLYFVGIVHIQSMGLPCSITHGVRGYMVIAGDVVQRRTVQYDADRLFQNQIFALKP